MRLYHRTTRANADIILRQGFLDHVDRHTSDFGIEGVWFSDQPENAADDAVVSIDFALSAKELSAFEWMEGERSYREWLIPTKVVNAKRRKMQICREAVAEGR